jgi:hypothetical protein
MDRKSWLGLGKHLICITEESAAKLLLLVTDLTLGREPLLGRK